jgi:hypothetical protein
MCEIAISLTQEFISPGSAAIHVAAAKLPALP